MGPEHALVPIGARASPDQNPNQNQSQSQAAPASNTFTMKLKIDLDQTDAPITANVMGPESVQVLIGARVNLGLAVND